MERTVIYRNQCYLLKVNFDVFFLRDTFKTPAMVERLLKDAEPISIKDLPNRIIYKFEDDKWYFWEHDFMCWECANDYKPQPHLDPDIQYRLMEALIR